MKRLGYKNWAAQGGDWGAIVTLIHYVEADKGGHFAALEQPEILISEIAPG